MESNSKAAQSIPAFCEDNGIGRTLTYDEIRSGRLRSMKVGKRRLITAEAAAEWRRVMEQQTAEEGADA